MTGSPNPQDGFPANYLTNPALNRAFDHFWANDAGPGGVGLQARYAAAWGHVAARFASAKHTLGFDLMNEPWPGTAYPTCAVLTGCPGFDNSVLAPFYRSVIAAIRSADPGKLLWYEPNVIFNFGADTNIPAMGDRSLGMSFHLYCLAGLVAGTAGQSCPALDEQVLQNADKHAQATGDALMLSEFGATDDLATIRQNVQQADQHMVSWEYWHYCECLDPTTSGSGTQAIVIDPNQPPTGSNVKQAKLDVLSEPYPQVVAGTPTAYGFDPATGRFTLAYSTKGPTGKNFARRLPRRSGKMGKAKFRQTQIFLPKDHYQAGYSVSVRGGGIASKRKAGLLKVIACPGKSAVSVTVLPGRGRNHVDCRVTPKRSKRGRRPRVGVLGFIDRNHLGRAGRAEHQAARRPIRERSLLLRVGQRGAAVLAAVGQLLDRAFLEFHDASLFRRLVGRQTVVPVAQHPERRPEALLRVLGVE